MCRHSDISTISIKMISTRARQLSACIDNKAGYDIQGFQHKYVPWYQDSASVVEYLNELH
jgi:hypothetical protein